MSTYIYGLKDPRTKDVRYVGKANSPQARFKTHLCDKTTNLEKAAWIDDLAANDLKPLLVVFEEVASRDWARAERHWIGLGHLRGWSLLNGKAGIASQVVDRYGYARYFLPPEFHDEYDNLPGDVKDSIVYLAAEVTGSMFIKWHDRKLQGLKVENDRDFTIRRLIAGHDAVYQAMQDFAHKV